MKILQVVTTVTDDNAYGGPVTVARNLAGALRRRGHQVVLLAGRRGSPEPEVGEVLVPVRPWLPRSRFSGLLSVRFVRSALREIRKADVVHVHLARDLVPLVAAVVTIMLRRPLLAQTHGMVEPDRRLRARLMDTCVTRPVLRRAAAVLVLTESERSAVSSVCPAASSRQLINGVPPTTASVRPLDDHPRTVFLARLHERKRVGDFIRLARRAGFTHPGSLFVIAGPDDGDLHLVHAAMSDPELAHLSYAGTVPPAEVPAFLAGFHLMVLPSQAEPFPMSVLEALSVGLPAIVRDDSGVATLIAEREAGAVFAGDGDNLYEAWDRLASDPERWRAASAAARALSLQAFSVDAVAEELESLYVQARRHVRSRTGSTTTDMAR